MWPPLSNYIPLGTLLISREASGLSPSQCAAVVDSGTWIPLGPTEFDDILDRYTAEELDAHIWVGICYDLIKCPVLKPWEGLLYAHWIRMEFSAKPDTGGLVTRVYALPDDVYRRSVNREVPKLKKARIKLFEQLDFSKDVWSGVYPAFSTPRQASPVPAEGTPSQEGMKHRSLLALFNSIPPPNPDPEITLDPEVHAAEYSLLESKVPGLTSTLYPHQRRSAAVMLEKESDPGKVLDPRLLPVLDQHGNTWYFDHHDNVVLKERRYYDGVNGGILAEEMGTGKTIICLSLILATRHLSPLAPEAFRGGSPPVREKVASLADMVASSITRHSVPWVYYFESADTLYGLDFTHCVNAIRRNPGYYLCPGEPTENRRIASRRAVELPEPEMTKVYLSRASVIIVPTNLHKQWQQEIRKHTQGLKVLAPESRWSKVPDTMELLDYDIILLQQSLTDHVANNSWLDSLKNIHFKRCIVDEGDKLGNSKMGNKSNLLEFIESLRFSSRWIVTGTPAQGLFGVDGQLLTSKNASEPQLESGFTKQETQDLKRIGSMAALYLKARPWANTSAEMGDTTADWTRYMMHQSVNGRRSNDCLRSTLNSLIIRHPKEETKQLLPSVQEKIVVLDGSYQDRLSINIFSMFITFNAVQSQRTDRDYFFHSSQAAALRELVHNMKQATFFGGSFYTTYDLRNAISTADMFLAEGKVPISDEDAVLLKEAIDFGHMAVDNEIRNLSNEVHEVPLHVTGFPGSAGQAWSLDDKGEEPVLTDATMLLSLQKLIRTKLDSPTALNALLNGGLVEEGKARKSKTMELIGSDKIFSGDWSQGPSPVVFAGNVSLGDGRTPRKVRESTAYSAAQLDGEPVADEDDREIHPLLAPTKVVSTSSAKLSYLIDSITRYQAEEQIIVFYDNENVAWYIAGILDTLQIRHLIYAKGLTTLRKAQYINSFNQTPRFRVLLMDISQAAFGLDMRAASRIYFTSPVLNPQVEAQAIGRARRISQQKPVSVEILVLRDSIDEVILSRRQNMTQAEHRKCKSILDDRPIYNWIRNVKILPMAGGAAGGPSQMAPLQAPQLVFGNGFGRIVASDEGLVLGDVLSPVRNGAERTNGVKRELPADLAAGDRVEGDRDIASRPARRVRFAGGSDDEN